MRTRAVVVAAAALVAVTGCGESGGSGDLDRIDGPAQVDPDYQPVGDDSVPATSGG